MPHHSKIRILCLFCGKDITEQLRRGFYTDDVEEGKELFHAIETDDADVVLFCNKRCLRLHLVYWDSIFEDSLA